MQCHAVSQGDKQVIKSAKRKIGNEFVYSRQQKMKNLFTLGTVQ